MSTGRTEEIRATARQLPHLTGPERDHIEALRRRLAFLEQKLAKWDMARESKGAWDFINAERSALVWALHVLTVEIADG